MIFGRVFGRLLFFFVVLLDCCIFIGKKRARDKYYDWIYNSEIRIRHQGMLTKYGIRSHDICVRCLASFHLIRSQQTSPIFIHISIICALMPNQANGRHFRAILSLWILKMISCLDCQSSVFCSNSSLLQRNRRKFRVFLVSSSFLIRSHIINTANSAFNRTFLQHDRCLMWIRS